MLMLLMLLAIALADADSHVYSHPCAGCPMLSLRPAKGLTILLTLATCMHAGLALWVTDRLYEANAEELITGIGDNAMAVSDAGKWTALAVLIGVRLGWGARGLLRPLQVQVEAVEDDKPNLEPPTVQSAHRKRKAMEKMVNRIQKVRHLVFILIALAPLLVVS